MELQPTPVEREARRLAIPVLTPKTLRTAEAEAQFRAHRADLAVVVAYGLILPTPILDAPPLGCFNLHASALPRWRGAAPINRAIMAGDTKTAAMVMKMEEGLDTGPIVKSKQVLIRANMTAGALHDKLMIVGADLVARTLETLKRKRKLVARIQPVDGVTYAAKIDKAESRIDWSKPHKIVHDHCRGLSPFPGAWCEINGTRMKVLKTIKSRKKSTAAPGTVLDDELTVACGEGAIRIVNLQPANKRAMTAEEYLRGNPIAPGTVLN
jgi:methionyl-tRNA formyltransferase